MPDASRTIVGTDAGFDLLPADEALDLADDVGTAGIIVGTAGIIVRTAVIIVSTDGYVVCPRGNELSGRQNEGTDRGSDAGKGDDDLTGVGTDLYTAGNVLGKRAGDRSAFVE